MKNIIKTTLIIINAIALSSCGSGDINCNSNEVNSFVLNIRCNDDISSYIPLLSNDIILKNEDNTTIRIFHDESNQKVICIKSGSATITRVTNN